MISASAGINTISKVTEALVGLYETREEKERILEDVGKLDEYFEKETDVFCFLTDRSINKELKTEVLTEIAKGGVDKYLMNLLFILVDCQLIYHLKLFLSTLRTKLQRELKIKPIFVYSSFEIGESQKKRLEELWGRRLPSYSCEFIYAIDKSLRLGIKVQIGNFVEEFNVRTFLIDLELKLDTVLYSI